MLIEFRFSGGPGATNDTGRELTADEGVDEADSNSFRRALSERASCWSFSCSIRSCSEICLNAEEEVDHLLVLFVEVLVEEATIPERGLLLVEYLSCSESKKPPDKKESNESGVRGLDTLLAGDENCEC